MPRVALVKGDVRYDNIFNALELIATDVERIVSKSYRIVLLPNFLYPKNESTLTNADAARAVLDFITQFTNKPITIASSSFSLADVFADYHYSRFQDSYSVKLADLNKDEFITLKNIGRDVSKTMLESDCRISLGLLHTHNVLLANLSISHFLLSALSQNEKKHIMHDPKIAHLTISALSNKLMPHLSVIDGFSGIQGDFPLATNIVEEANVAIAGDSCLAVDTVAASLMGIKPNKISYLRRSSKGKLNPRSIRLVGETMSNCRVKFTLPSNSSNLMKL
jgi:uncharacterized protein (DUF362 family)